VAENKEDDNPNMHFTRVVRRSKPTERLHYDALACSIILLILKKNNHGVKQYLIANTIHHHQATKQPERETSSTKQ
jgi:hypothetical protein